MNRVTWAAEFEDYVDQIQEEYQIPGLAAAFAKNGEVVYARGFGVRDRGNALEANTDTVFGIGSVTKSFTCMAIMQLQDEGKLSVDDPVALHLPEFGVPDEALTSQITIHHFMTHLTGLPPQPALGFALAPTMKNHPSYDPDAEGPEEEPEVPPMERYEHILEYLRTAEYELLGKPNDFFSYSNDAYALLGTIIERVSGMDYAQFVTERILVPAAMNRSTFSREEMAEWDNVTEIYFENKKKEIVDVSEWPDSWSFRAAGFLRSTVMDMLNYGQVYLNGGTFDDEQILSQNAVESMIAPHHRMYGDLHYGYGLMIQPNYEGVTLVEHGGAITGVAAQFGFVPEENITGVVLTNLAGVPSSKIWLAGVNAILGLPLDHKRAEYTEIDLPREKLERFTGDFISGEGAKITIALEEDGKMFAEMSGQKIEVRPIAEDRLLMLYRGSEMPIDFYRDEDGGFYAAFFGFRMIRKELKEADDNRTGNG